MASGERTAGGAGRRTLRNWVSRIAVTVMAVSVGTVVMQQPAAAHSENICSSMSTGAVNVLSQGSVRQVPSHGHNHDIGWSTASSLGCSSNFPSGAQLRVRVRFLQRSASGGCTTTNIGDGSLFIYTGAQTGTLVTDVLPGTCYRLIWRPANSAAANRTIPGTLFLRQS